MRKIFTLAVALLVLISATACTKKVEDVSDMGYKVGVGSYTETSQSTPSTATANGKGVVSTTYVTAIFDSQNVIRRVCIDEVETKVYFDVAGQLVPNSDGEVKSKRELGDAYNMKPASAIGKEWYEQVDSLEKYLEGKMITDITAGMDMSDTKRITRQRNIDSNVTDGTSTGTASMPNSDSSMMTNSSSGAMSDSTGGTMGDIMDSAIGDGMTSGMTDGTDGSSGMTGGMTGGTTSGMWQEDLKSSVTIDLTNIQMALKKAYENAK